MQIKTLTIDNFCQYSHSEINFDDFTNAIIIGQKCGNLKDSNGVGKSALLSALKWALFNQTDYTHLEKIIRNGTDACEVAVTLIADDGETYKIVRSRHKKTGSEVRFFRASNSDWIDLTSRTNSQTEKSIEKIIQINYKTFCNSILFAQQDITGLAALTPADRKKILRETLSLSVYAKYEQEAKKRTADLVKEIDRAKTILSTLGEPEHDIKNIKAELATVERSLRDDLTNSQGLKTQYEDDNKKYIDTQKELENITKTSNEFYTKETQLKNEIHNVSLTIKDYDHKIANIRSAGTVLATEIKEINSNIKNLAGTSLRDIKDIKTDIEAITKLIIEQKGVFGSFNSKMAELKVPLPEGGVCKHCRRPITTEDRQHCQKAIAEEITEVMSKIKTIQEEIKSLQSKRDTLQAELERVSDRDAALQQKKNSLATKQKELEAKKSIFVEFNELFNKATATHKEKEELFRVLLDNKPKDNSETINKIKTDISSYKIHLDILKAKIENYDKSIMSLTNRKAVLEHRIKERAKDIEKISEQTKAIQELERKYVVHQKVVNAFGSKGIPTMITHSVLDDLQFATNSFLSKLKPDLQAQFIIEKEKSDGDVGDTLDIMFQLGANDFEFAQLSGAQKIIASFALRLGLAEVMKKRLGVSVNLLLLDEVDQALDESNMETFADVIKKLAEEYKLIVISHNNELKDRFHKAILVEQNADLVSTAKVVNVW